MAKKCLAGNFAALGADSATAAELVPFGLDHGMVGDLSAFGAVSWLRLLSFVRKYSSWVPQIMAAYASGGWAGVFAFAVAHAADLPDLVKDFLAVFGEQAAEPGPVVGP